jgi:hypothetical protein
VIKTIITHSNVDLDATSSVWAAKQFIPGARNATVEFRPGDWTPPDDFNASEHLILDMRAGLKGDQNDEGRVHSCFASIVSTYASKEDQMALQHLVRFIDTQDMYGSVVHHLFPDLSHTDSQMLNFTGINAVLRCLQSMNPKNDPLVYEKMSEIFSGMLKTGRARIRAIQEAMNARLFKNGAIAIVYNPREYGTNAVLFENGVRIIIYVDKNNIGIIRRDDEHTRADHEVFREVVASEHEEAEWFAHPSGFLYCRGSRKAPASTPSKINPVALAVAAVQILS